MVFRRFADGAAINDPSERFEESDPQHFGWFETAIAQKLSGAARMAQFPVAPAMTIFGIEPQAAVRAVLATSSLRRLVDAIEISPNTSDKLLEGTLSTEAGEIHFKVDVENGSVRSLRSVILNPALRREVSLEFFRALQGKPGYPSTQEIEGNFPTQCRI